VHTEHTGDTGASVKTEKLCRSAESVYKEALHPEYGKAIAALARCLLEKHTLMENEPSSCTSKR
jgi:hypothetical protein